MILEQIEKIAKSGTVIPKPMAKSDFVIKGWGKRRREIALIYRIPNQKNPGFYYEKGITKSEFEKAYQQILNNGNFSTEWFNQNMQGCAKEGGCNFTTIGGIFELLGLVNYERGIYRKK
jgi:hypothetical protein